MDEQIGILVVDDEEVMRSLLCDVLSEVGYKVESVSNGEAALEKFRQEEGFSILITDLMMPGMSGMELLRRVKAINSSLCVIVITAYPSLESVIETMRAGAYDFIVKPFNIEEIKLIIRRAAERQHLLSEANKKEFYRELSILDGLTGIYNHRHFYEVLSREVERAKRYNHILCLLMIDLDDFKTYNDAYGHVVGDKLLQDFAEFFVKTIRSTDMVFRYGGDEFSIIYPETSKEGGMEISRRILSMAKEKMPLSISIGLSCFPGDANTMNDLIARADEALYRAKESGKNAMYVAGQKNEL